jgi:hypothetical protein
VKVERIVQSLSEHSRRRSPTWMSGQGRERILGEAELGNSNPYLGQFLTIYSQSEKSTGGTRGYDEKTYVDTKLDKSLIPRIFDPRTKLVILTGNAGDGKTAFIQNVEKTARQKGAAFYGNTDNGRCFKLTGINYTTLYDGSQDFEGARNDEILAEFFRDFEGDGAPEGDFTKIIAINEGKLRDFILYKPQYKWLGKQVHHYLDYDNFRPHESLVFVNLNLRSVVDDSKDNLSIFDLLMDKLLDADATAGFWDACEPENCDYADRCYIKYNVGVLRDPEIGPDIRGRLKRLLLAIHLRKNRHITMRDLRSIISFILFSKKTCFQLQQDFDASGLLVERFYYNAAFNSQETDRVTRLLAELDVALVSNPKLDNFVHFHAPDSPEVQALLLRGESRFSSDLPHLKTLYENRPQGTQDDDPDRQQNARLYHASMRRKLFFEGDEKKMKAAGLPTWMDLLPYRQFDRFLDVISSGQDTGSKLRDELTLSVSKSERIYNETVGREHLCIRSTGPKRTPTKSFYGFPASDFEVVVKDIGFQAEFLEYLPTSIFYRHVDKSAELEIPLDLFEVLCRIHDGYIPTASEVRTFFLNLEMFKRRVTSKRSDSIFLTEDDTNLFEIRSDPSRRLVMSKLGG